MATKFKTSNKAKIGLSQTTRLRTATLFKPQNLKMNWFELVDSLVRKQKDGDQILIENFSAGKRYFNRMLDVRHTVDQQQQEQMIVSEVEKDLSKDFIEQIGLDQTIKQEFKELLINSLSYIDQLGFFSEERRSQFCFEHEINETQLSQVVNYLQSLSLDGSYALGIASLDITDFFLFCMGADSSLAKLKQLLQDQNIYLMEQNPQSLVDLYAYQEISQILSDFFDLRSRFTNSRTHPAQGQGMFPELNTPSIEIDFIAKIEGNTILVEGDDCSIKVPKDDPNGYFLRQLQYKTDYGVVIVKHLLEFQFTYVQNGIISSLKPLIRTQLYQLIKESGIDLPPVSTCNFIIQNKIIHIEGKGYFKIDQFFSRNSLTSDPTITRERIQSLIKEYIASDPLLNDMQLKNEIQVDIESEVNIKLIAKLRFQAQIAGHPYRKLMVLINSTIKTDIDSKDKEILQRLVKLQFPQKNIKDFYELLMCNLIAGLINQYRGLNNKQCRLKLKSLLDMRVKDNVIEQYKDLYILGFLKELISLESKEEVLSDSDLIDRLKQNSQLCYLAKGLTKSKICKIQSQAKIAPQQTRLLHYTLRDLLAHLQELEANTDTDELITNIKKLKTVVKKTYSKQVGIDPSKFQKQLIDTLYANLQDKGLLIDGSLNQFAAILNLQDELQMLEVQNSTIKQMLLSLVLLF